MVDNINFMMLILPVINDELSCKVCSGLCFNIFCTLQEATKAQATKEQKVNC
jgi:hypothetical protein